MMKRILGVIVLSGITGVAYAHNLPADNGFLSGLAHVLAAPDHWMLMLLAGVLLARIDRNVFAFTAVLIASLLVMHGFHPLLGYWALLAFLTGVLGSSIALLFAGRAIGRQLRKLLLH
jgi:hypothetical protein